MVLLGKKIMKETNFLILLFLEFQIPLWEDAQKNLDNNKAYKAFLNHNCGKDFMLFEQLYVNPNSNPIKFP